MPDESSVQTASSALAWAALAMPLIGFFGAWFFGNPFTTPPSEWGTWFMIALVWGGMGIAGLVMGSIALSQNIVVAGMALALSGLLALAALGVFMG
ncbi:MAG: hypothetical protein J0L97_01110 [Alphaproteobacteria bacterium]|nr:hypothetical protein [Alphaproteobacteria bacterium]